jgi:hypothetical protein
MGDDGKKRSKKGLIGLLLAAVGAIFVVKKRRGSHEAGWEEAKPEA